MNARERHSLSGEALGDKGKLRCKILKDEGEYFLVECKKSNGKTFGGEIQKIHLEELGVELHDIFYICLSEEEQKAFFQPGETRNVSPEELVARRKRLEAIFRLVSREK